MSFDKGEWKPNKKQALFLALPTTIKEAMYGGGAGSGKSDVLMVYALINRWHLNANFKQVFQRRTYPELRNEIIPRSQGIYPKFGATLNKSEMCWTFPREDQFGGRGMTNDGARIFLAHCEDENDVHKFDSMEINLYTPDELTSFTEFIYLYIGFTRTRTSDPNLPAIIRTAGMPGGIGHSFVYKRFVKSAPEGGKILVGRGGNKRIYIHSTQADNHAIDPAYAQSLSALTDAEKKAKLYGDWNSYQGQVFDEFRDKRYPDEPDNALHVAEPFEIPAWWPRIIVGDWGFTAMTWIGFAAISPTGRIYIYRELAFIKTRIAEWAPILKAFIDKENPRVIKFCKSAGQDRGQENTIQEQISKALETVVELTNNSPGSRIAGKMLIHEYLRWKLKPTSVQESVAYSEEMAMYLLRNRGLEEYKSYLATFDTPKEEIDIPRLQIFDSCPILIETIKSCSYDKPRKNKPAEDVAEFEGDDPYDGLRYLLDAVSNYFETAKEEFGKVQKVERLVHMLENTQDYTAYYRNMRSIESVSPDQVKPVQRYHRR